MHCRIFTLLTLPNIMSVTALGDVLVGSVLFLSAAPVLFQLWVFQPCPPPCLLLIKPAPGGRTGRAEGNGDGVSHVCGSHIPHVSSPSDRYKSGKEPLQQGISAHLQYACTLSTLQRMIHSDLHFLQHLFF